MSDTPRTDAACSVDGKLFYWGSYVDADFARQLERELTAERERREKAEAALNDLIPSHDAFNHDYDYQMKTCSICVNRKKHAAAIERAKEGK